MKEDPKKQCETKFRVERTHSSTGIGRWKPVFPKPKIFDRFRISSEASMGTSQLACMSILKLIGPFLKPGEHIVFSWELVPAAILKNQFFLSDSGSFRSGWWWYDQMVIYLFSSWSDQKQSCNGSSKCANFCKISKVSLETKLSDETSSFLGQRYVIRTHWGGNWKIFKMADNGPTVHVRDGQKWSKYGFFEFIP